MTQRNSVPLKNKMKAQGLNAKQGPAKKRKQWTQKTAELHLRWNSFLM